MLLDDLRQRLLRALRALRRRGGEPIDWFRVRRRPSSIAWPFLLKPSTQYRTFGLSTSSSATNSSQVISPGLCVALAAGPSCSPPCRSPPSRSAHSLSRRAFVASHVEAVTVSSRAQVARERLTLRLERGQHGVVIRLGRGGESPLLRFDVRDALVEKRRDRPASGGCTRRAPLQSPTARRQPCRLPLLPYATPRLALSHATQRVTVLRTRQMAKGRDIEGLLVDGGCAAGAQQFAGQFAGSRPTSAFSSRADARPALGPPPRGVNREPVADVHATVWRIATCAMPSHPARSMQGAGGQWEATGPRPAPGGRTAFALLFGSPDGQQESTG